MRASKEARTHRRWREQVARLIAESMTEHWHPITRPLEVAGLAHSLLGGMHFDVAVVRSYAERLIAEGERLERERVVFADWTRERGMGPENRGPVVFVREHRGVNELRGSNVCGGWPGPLAREWGTVRCEACEGKGRIRESQTVVLDDVRLPLGWQTVPCKPCKGRGYVKRHGREPAAANGGAWMIRAGRRLLATLDGRCPWAPSAERQASECQRPDCEYSLIEHEHGLPTLMRGGKGWGLGLTGHSIRAVDFNTRLTCNAYQCTGCRGTGRNLSGTLPPVEHSPKVCRAAMDGIEAAGNRSQTQWQRDVAMQWARAMVGPPFRTLTSTGEVVRATTRVVPRGQHRTLTQAEARAYGVQAWRGDEPSEWAARAVAHALDRDPDKTLAEMREHHALGMRHLPRWRRGELRHSEQRRERERRRAAAEVDRFRETNARLRDLVEMDRPVGTVREVRADGSVVVDLDL